jgi:hypothetical protein
MVKSLGGGGGGTTDLTFTLNKENRAMYTRVLVGKCLSNWQLEKLSSFEDNTENDFMKMGCEMWNGQKWFRNVMNNHHYGRLSV